jgi:lipopolysaccharide/colanic/teichoic acid biosynthesis glycosyltransferase
VVRQEVDELDIAPFERRKSLPVYQVLDCKMSGIKVIDLLTFFEQETSRINTDILYPSWIFFSTGFERGGMADYVKRLLDIVGSLLILVAGAPLLLGSVLAILSESRGRGPVLFHQTRVGRNGRHFELYKFRIMRADGVTRWAQKNDSRITLVGAFLRKTRLDEMPQAFNVLRGDMSLVGPRPERPEFVEELARKLPFYHERHRAEPGLTG